ncbi:energy transducer TonB [uncultured Roseivirga sp.]|uniref:energy transducer TonB n=1 Tax=uncultured Roseivirga sp. TaxID=543088 RepID=UPI0030DD3143|tara:strand:+ start:119138 stop:119644 length:507 start_codon:yes stop_codon:yes gene_type:complete
MKKSTILFAALLFVAFSCSDEDMRLESIDEVGRVERVAGVQNSDKVFIIVEEPPTFPGGVDAYKKHLLTNLKYPEQAKKDGIEGNVFVSFVVNKEGKLENIQVTRGIGGGCDTEAVRMLLTSPDWIPGKQRGRLVNARMSLRVAFSLSGNVTQVQDDGAQVIVSTPAI